MASSYYDKSGKSVSDGNIAYANDLNQINEAVDTGFQQVEAAIDDVSDDAEIWAAKSQKWAEEAEDVEVEAGKYSSLHHAAKSSASASTSTTKAAEASASASSASTSAGTATTKAAEASASAASSAQDAIDTAADLVATNQDAIDTAADLIATNQDTIDTAADRVQTGLDATSATASAATASTSETNAASSESAASTSETNAAASESAASTSETNAGTSETNALASENKAEEWAEKPEDTEVETGKYSALHWAAKAAASAGVQHIVGTTDEIEVDETDLNNPIVSISPNYSRRKNFIINGNFDIWQRGTSQTLGGYRSDDRWRMDRDVSTIVCSQQVFTLGQTDVPHNPIYYSRIVTTTGGTAPSYVLKRQRIEGVKTLSGTTATLSFWAKADTSRDITTELMQDFGTGGSPSATVDSIGINKVALTTSWQRFEITISIPSISGKTLGTDGDDYLSVGFWFDAGSDWDARTDSLGTQSGTFDISQVQLEIGSKATVFEHRTFGEELALCQRYYEVGQLRVDFYITGATNVRQTTQFIVTKRTVPTVAVTGSGLINIGTIDAVSTTTEKTDIGGTSTGTGNVRYTGVSTADAEL